MFPTTAQIASLLYKMLVSLHLGYLINLINYSLAIRKASYPAVTTKLLFVFSNAVRFTSATFFGTQGSSGS